MTWTCWAEVFLILRELSARIRSLQLSDVYSRDALSSTSAAGTERLAAACIEDDEVAQLDVVLGTRAFWDLEELGIGVCVAEVQLQPGMQEEMTAHIQSRLPRLMAQSGVKLRIS